MEIITQVEEYSFLHAPYIDLYNMDQYIENSLYLSFQNGSILILIAAFVKE